jgi:hypothetical protein
LGHCPFTPKVMIFGTTDERGEWPIKIFGWHAICFLQMITEQLVECHAQIKSN